MQQCVEVKKSGGICIRIKSKNILFDPTRYPSVRPDLILVSHAHSDHVSGSLLRKIRSIPIVMSEPTYEILYGTKRRKPQNFIIINEGEVKEINNIEVRAINAGHCVGSLQFFLNTDPSILFTGDFNLQSRIILNPAKILESDVLIIDATYGDPRYIFPKRSKLYKTLLELIRDLLEVNDYIFIAARTLGTSQEITALLNMSTLGIDILAEPRIFFMNKIHEKYEDNLQSYHIINDLNKIDKFKGVILISLSKSYTFKNDKPIITCTGWAATWKNLLSLPISSHSDFNDIITYIKKSKAGYVVPVYGFIEKISNIISEELGVKVIRCDK